MQLTCGANTYSCIGDGRWWPESYYLSSNQARQAHFLVRAPCWSLRVLVSHEQCCDGSYRKLQEQTNLLEKKLRGS